MEQRGAQAYLLHRVQPSIERFNRQPITSAKLLMQMKERLLCDGQTISLSYRTLADFIVCPYRFYINNLLRPTVHISQYDDDLARRTGILQHRIMGAFFPN